MEDLVVGDLIIPGTDLEERFETSGGPGGQHANRSETAVRLRLRVADCSLPDDTKQKLISRIGEVIEVVAAEERSQLRNRERARQRMASRIEEALAEPKPRKPTKPTKTSRNRRLSAKKARSDIKKQRRRPDTDD